MKHQTGELKTENMFGSGQNEVADNDSSLFPPISKRSANFNGDDYMRSLDPLDKTAGEINLDDDLTGTHKLQPRPLFKTDGVVGQRRRKVTVNA